MRQLNSLGSAVAALLVSGIYGFVVVTVAGFIFALFIGYFFQLIGLGRGNIYVQAAATYFFLGILSNPLGGIIWGWTMAFLREKRNAFLGVLLSTVGPVAVLVYLKAPEDWISRAEYSRRAIEPAKVFMFGLTFVFFGIMALLWQRKGGIARRFPWQSTLQGYVDSSSLGRSSSGMRLLTIAALASVLVLATGRYLFWPIFD